MIRPTTRPLYINQPHNPTGTLMARRVFEDVIELARAHGLVLFSDEVYRELEYNPADRLPAACDMYERAVSLGSISKSYGLPGLRIGWIATRDASIREAVSTLKDYTTICASAPSEFLTALALRNRKVLLDRQTTSGSASVGLTCARLWNSSRLTSPAAIDAATTPPRPPQGVRYWNA
jgi:aspartate/methionine/tyrosine aminotransferase